MNSLDFDKALFNKYYRSLCYFAWQMVKDEILAEDLVQDAFVSYFQNKDKVSTEELAIKSFLYATIRFSVFNRSRKDKTIQKFWQRNTFQEAADIDYEHQIIRAEFIGTVYNCIAELPEGCRMVMMMCFVDGFSNEEVANKLNISVNTVRTQKQRGLRVLRGKLKSSDFAMLLMFFL